MVWSYPYPWWYCKHLEPNLSIRCLSHLHLSVMLFCFYISLSPTSLLLHSWAVFFSAWRIHLVCGWLKSGVEAFFFFGGGAGSLLNRYLLLAPVGSVRADADFPLRWTHWLEVSTGAQLQYPAGRNPGWQAPTSARGVSLPHGWPCLCFSYVATSFLLCCSEHRTTQLGSNQNIQMQVANWTAPPPLQVHM